MTLAAALEAFHACSSVRDRDGAAHAGRMILDRWPDDYLALDLVGAMLYELGEHALALACADRACRSPNAQAIQHARRAAFYGRSGDLATAMTAARCALDLAPANGALCLELGRLFVNGAAYEDAARAYAAAVAADPMVAAAHLALGVVLMTLGRNVEAAQAVRRAADLDGGAAGTMAMLATIEGALHGPDRAIAILTDAADRYPSDVTTQIALARLLMQAERPDDALPAIKRAAAILPHEPVVMEIHAACLQDLGDHEAALAILAQAETTDRAPYVFAKKGAVLTELGRTSEAALAFDRALSLEPNLAVAWYGRCDLREVAPSLDDVAAMEAALDSSPRLSAYDDRMTMHFAVARTALACGDAERAFRHFSEGNRMKRATLTYDVADDERMMEATARAIDAAFIERAGPGEPSEVPVFVVGMPRSGTTLVEQILAAHPAIHGAGELPDVPLAIESLPDFPEPPHLAAAGRAYVERLRRLAPHALRIVDKLPANFLRVGLMHAMLPNARIIHVRRDPLDTCMSCYSLLFAGRQLFSYDLVELGRFYRAYHTLMAHWRSIIPPDRLLEIDYEVMVEDVESTARRLIAHCGLAWDPACLRFYESTSPIRTASKTQVREPVFRTSIGRAERLRPYLAPLIAALGPT